MLKSSLRCAFRPLTAKLRPVQSITATRLLRSYTSAAQPGASLSDRRLISAEEMKILQREQSLLSQLQDIFKTIDAENDDKELVERALKQLEELFLVVVVGEFNSGKSSFINALLGHRYLKEGVTPTTNTLHIVRHGDNIREEFDAQNDRVLTYLPLTWLKDLNLVDTPGTNAIIKRHQSITEHFVPRSDLVLFVTSCERPFSESEHEFLERVKNWGKKIVIILNKYDILDSEQQLEVERFVRNGIIQTLGFEPQIFMVSAKKALEAKIAKSLRSFQSAAEKANGELAKSESEDLESQRIEKLWQTSQFEPLEKYIFDTLDSTERIKLKLLSPLGVADSLCTRYTRFINDRLAVLKDDKETVDIVDKQLQVYKEEMLRDFEVQMLRVENILYQLIERGNRFIDDTLIVRNIGKLMMVNREKIREEFQQNVILDTTHDIERGVSSMIDWVIERKYKQWKAVTDFVTRRAKAATNEEKLIGTVKSEFDFNRQGLLLSIGQSADNVIHAYDREGEIDRFKREIASGVYTTVGMGMGALSLGAATLFLMPPALLDITAGLAGASVIAAASLYVLPFKRSKLRKQFQANVDALRVNLREQIRQQFEKDLNDSADSIRNAIAPYAQFVKIESNKFEDQKVNLSQIHNAIHQMQATIKSLKD